MRGVIDKGDKVLVATVQRNRERSADVSVYIVKHVFGACHCNLVDHFVSLLPFQAWFTYVRGHFPV